MVEPTKQPTMYVLAGPNGAGKTTLYETVIKPRRKAPFINADKIQKDELKDPSMRASYRAAKIAEDRRREYIEKKQSFITESTFSHPSKIKLINDAKGSGYKVVLFHVNVRSVNLSIARVANRVDEGGHNVPEDKIRERYERNQNIIKKAVLVSDMAFIYDNSSLNKPPSLSISFSNGRVDRISENIPAWARKLYKEELRPFSKTRQNAAVASFEDIQEIAKHIGGEGVNVLIPFPKKNAYEGKIVGESHLHVLQQASENQFIAHCKTSLDKKTYVGQSVSIAYTSKFKSHVDSLSHVSKNPKKTGHFSKMANVWATKSTEEVLKNYPELTGAVAIIVEISNKVKNDGLTPDQQTIVLARAKQNITRRIEQGDIPKLKVKSGNEDKDITI